MFNRKSIYALNKKDPNAIVYNESTIMLEQLRTLDKQRLLGYAGTVGKSKMREVNTALEISIGIKDLLPDNKRK